MVSSLTIGKTMGKNSLAAKKMNKMMREKRKASVRTLYGGVVESRDIRKWREVIAKNAVANIDIGKLNEIMEGVNA